MTVCNSDELTDLINHWGTAYEISAHGAEWIAARRDNRKALTAGSARELLDAIRRDYRANPVPRDC
jgi:hypothetical protein